MLKKLYGYEFRSVFKTLLPIYLAVIGLSLFTGIAYALPTNNTAAEMMRITSTALYGFSVIAMYALAVCFVVIRFYRNLLSKEGYLTFSMPFTATQHLNCKLITSFVAVISTLLVMCLSVGCLLLICEPEFIGRLFSEMLKNTSVMFTVVVVLLVLFGIIASLLTFYTAMSVGQLFKSKIGGAIGAYLCITAALETIVTISIFPITILMDKIIYQLPNPLDYMTVLMGIYLVLIILYDVGAYLVTRKLLTNKLNLQ